MARFGSLGTQYLDNSGKPLSGGGIYFFESGGSVAKTAYSDADQTVPHPVPVPLDAAGRQPPIFFNGAAKAQLVDGAGALVQMLDPVGAATTRDAFSDWNALLTYDAEDIVRGSDNRYYQAITNSNIGLDPTSSGANWQQLVFPAVWNAGYNYEGGALVIGSNDALYRCTVASSLGDDPVDESATDWTLIGASGWSALIEDLTPQLGGNLDLNTHTVGAATAADLTKLNAVTATAVQLNYSVGVTSAIQTQLNAKAPLASPEFTGVVKIGANFSVEQDGTALVFKYGATRIAKLSSTGVITALSDVAKGTV